MPDWSGPALGPFYATRLDSNEVPPGQGPGVGVGWLFGSSTRRAGLWVTGQYELGRSLVTPSVGLDWSTIVLRALLELSKSIDESMELGGRAGIGVNILSLSPTEGSSDEPILLSADRGAIELVFELGVQGCRRLGRRVGACARVFFDVHPERIRYGIERSGGVAYAFEPWVVRPGLALALLLR